MIDVVRRAEELIEDAVEAEGYELVHVEFVPVGANSVLRVFIDRPGGITVSDCAEVSRRLSVLLDVEDFIPSSYVLEVSSPGIERPLFKERDFRRFEGSEARIVTIEKIDNRRNFTGRILECKKGIVTFDVGDRVYQIPLLKIKKANLVYHFG